MASFLLTWNPNAWNWEDLDECIEDTSVGTEVEMRWSVGVTKRIKPNDVALLMRLGQEPKGVMAYGRFTSETFLGKSFTGEKGRLARYAEVSFQQIVSSDEVVPLDILKEKFPEKNWTPQASGQSVEDRTAKQVIRLLQQSSKPTSKKTVASFLEGAMQRVVSDRRERSQEARKQCTELHGLDCVVCGFNFEETYGAIGRGFIHVHHLSPLSGAQEEREVSPERDLAPVCANCHAIIHRRKSPFTIAEMRKMIRS